ncbi:hypothetical protein ACIPL1_09650 [Pseudomonas sp. NPDC090202]|uniref:hypothetical protein n=1 Tax=unclassified Pseudomonas TaxID=196821 RepID=UPI00380E8DC4
MTTMQPLRARKPVTPGALAQLKIPKLDATRLTFKIADLTSDIEVKVPKSAEMYPEQAIQLLVNGEKKGEPLTLADADFDNATEFDLTFKMADFPAAGTDTVVNVDYWIFDIFSGDGQPAGMPVTARFDRLAPGGDNPPPITFTADQLSGITEDDLVGDVLTAHISNYLDGAADDVLQLWMGSSATTGAFLTPTFTVTNPAMPTTVTISRADLVSLPDGVRFFGYQVTDWAGNVSTKSEPVQIDVFLEVPAALPAPVVPADADGLVTYPDAAKGVNVEIPAYNSAKAGDVLKVSWGGQALGPYSISAEEAAADPIVTLVVPYATVALVGNGTDIVVNYTLVRGGANRVSPDTLVDVNLDMPGGPDPDPDPETPEHENVFPATLTCGISDPNTIIPLDYGKDATVTLKRLSKKDSPIWQVDDVVQLTYGTLASPTIPAVTITAANEGADLRINLPFDTVIKAVGVGTVRMFFTITRTLNSAGGDIEVKILAPTQEVKVSSVDELPGSGTLELAFFPEATQIPGYLEYDAIQRAAGLDGTTFRIPLLDVSNIELSRGPAISYQFHGVVNTTLYPAPPGTELIPGTEREGNNIPITQAMLDQGYYEVSLTYQFLRLICRNGAYVGYMIRNDLGWTLAPPKYVYFALNVAGGSCPV